MGVAPANRLATSAFRTETVGEFGRTRARNWNLPLGLLLACCIARLWLMPLGSSFWVDEMGSTFVVRHGVDHPSLRIVPQIPATIYYALPRAAEWLLGRSEAAARFPSVLALGLALLLVARIAARLIHPDAGWFAAFACLALRGFNYQAADARPYALGSAIGCAAFLFLIRWLDTARWRDAAGFVLLAALLWRVHLIYWPIYGVFGLYLLVRLLRKETRVRWQTVAAVLATLGATLVPVLAGALSLYREAGAHVIMPVPVLRDLSAALKLGFVAGALLAGMLLCRLFGWPRGVHRWTWGGIALILGWWLVDPLCLYAFSRLTGNSVFVPRYLSLGLPGVALAATLAVGLSLPVRHWKTVSLLMGVGGLLLLGNWSQFWPWHHNSDWRSAAARLNQYVERTGAPVLAPSPFIEARSPVWQPGYAVSSFVYSHLLYYPVHGRILTLPFETSQPAERYAAGLASGPLAAAGRFAIYGACSNVRWWRNWFAARPDLARWHSRSLGTFGDVGVTVFERN